MNEGAHEGGVAVGAETPLIVLGVGDDPNLGGAAGNVVRFGPFAFREVGVVARRIDNGSEAFLRVFDEPKLIKDLLFVVGYNHR